MRRSKFYESRGHEKRELPVNELKEDITKLRLEMNDFYNYKPKWKCTHPEPPENLIDKSGKISKMSEKEQQSDTSETPIQLLSAKEGVLRAKNTNSDRGWTLEVTRNVSVGNAPLQKWIIIFFRRDSLNGKTLCIYFGAFIYQVLLLLLQKVF